MPLHLMSSSHSFMHLFWHIVRKEPPLM
ncbi:unnamed protein product [Linum tenue]|uniref:Uncharacterized protein n=1 Tax=Linum tenue TaxID=586396 RepID=A0AAV0I1H0_9ROSI|nr:unnamed protein product [Linum tenue]